MVARRQPDRLRVARKQEAGRLCAVALYRPAPGAGKLPRQQQCAGVVTGRPPPRGYADEGRRIADLHDQRRWQRRHASHQLGRHRHRGVVYAGWRVAPFHIRSRRYAADLSPQPRHQRRGAPDVRGQLQRVGARAARWQGVRVREARRRPLHACNPGLRFATSADADSGPA